jgi:acetyl-CoA/propionyl-CoA carboxylase, biotin carboxylase, biotin carboxyl carrier protein
MPRTNGAVEFIRPLTGMPRRRGARRRGAKRSMPAFKKILVANRGEIALRVIRACRELSVPVVAVYSDVDRESRHVEAADEAYRLGPAAPAQSYLNVERILEVARLSGCDAIHPGYGFLAENAGFARRCAAEGVMFIGPSPDVIDAMGGKIAARAAARKAGMPVVPGTDHAVASAAEIRAFAERFGYPIAIKASAGGGGKGLKIARSDKDVGEALDLAAKEAAAYFKDATVYVERYLAAPQHIEVQILGDKQGGVVHCGERECSMQRRHQKLVEETPANISPEVRERLTSAAVALARSIGYDSAGTIECLVEGDDFFFLEMNTRIQVEHTVSEMVWGLDLVKAQIRVAAGEPLWFAQRDLAPRGHAIECRINAEDPSHDFRPHAGRLERYVEPGGPGVRVDSSAYPGFVIPQEYDSMLGKLVVWGADREEAVSRMLRALREYRIEGVSTTIPFLRLLLAGEDFKRGRYATPTLERFCVERAADITAEYPPVAPAEPSFARPPHDLAVEVNDKRFVVRVLDDDSGARARRRPPAFKQKKRVAADGAAISAPMHGIVVEIRVKPGDAVEDGQVVAVIEAMKMMNEVLAHRAGKVASIHANAGDTVETGSPLITFE